MYSQVRFKVYLDYIKKILGNILYITCARDSYRVDTQYVSRAHAIVLRGPVINYYVHTRKLLRGHAIGITCARDNIKWTRNRITCARNAIACPRNTFTYARNSYCVATLYSRVRT